MVVGVWGCSQWAESRWRKTEQRSQRSAGGDSGSVGRPLRHILSGCGMTAQAQLVLDARAATGRSVQVIKPFMHSSTHPQALCASRLGKVTTVYHCFCWTLISLLPPFLSVLSRPWCLPFFLINPRLYLLSASLFPYTFTLANTLTLRTVPHSTWKSAPLPLSSVPSHLFPIPREWVLPHPTQRRRRACAPWMAAQICS